MLCHSQSMLQSNPGKAPALSRSSQATPHAGRAPTIRLHDLSMPKHYSNLLAMHFQNQREAQETTRYRQEKPQSSQAALRVAPGSTYSYRPPRYNAENAAYRTT